MPLVSVVTTVLFAVGGIRWQRGLDRPATGTWTWYSDRRPTVAGGSVHLTVADALPAVALPIIGAAGA